LRAHFYSQQESYLLIGCHWWLIPFLKNLFDNEKHFLNSVIYKKNFEKWQVNHMTMNSGQ
jgi:hypothetical protein